jgi:hypothetical protein
MEILKTYEEPEISKDQSPKSSNEENASLYHAQALTAVVGQAAGSWRWYWSPPVVCNSVSLASDEIRNQQTVL